MTCVFFYLKCKCKGKIPRCKAVQPPKRIFDVDACGCDIDDKWRECAFYKRKIEEFEKLL